MKKKNKYQNEICDIAEKIHKATAESEVCSINPGPSTLTRSSDMQDMHNRMHNRYAMQSGSLQ